MKNIMFISIFMFLGLFNSSHAQENTANNLDNYSLNSKKWNVSLSTSMTELESDLGGLLGIGLGYNLSENFELGLKAEALYYDKRLTKLDPNHTYHLEGGYTGIYLDWHPFGKGDFHFSIPVFTGTGIIFYKYDRQYKDDFKWYEMKLDEDIYSIFKIGLQFEGRIINNLSISADINFTATSPIKMSGVDEKYLNKLSGGLTFKYNF